MSNFDLSELRIVNPRDGWPNQKAEDMAAGGVDIIKNAKIFDTYEDAIADLSFLIATSARLRNIDKEVVSPDKCFSKIKVKGKVGIVFGRERIGLTNEEVVIADMLVSIPVSSKNPSINVAQSVVVMCYEWFISRNSVKQKKTAPAAQKSEVIHFYEHLESELEKVNFWGSYEKKDKMVVNIRNMFRKMNPTSQEIRTLRGIVKMLSGK